MYNAGFLAFEEFTKKNNIELLLGDDILPYATDWSLFEVRPLCVVIPKNIKDLKGIVSFVSRNKKQHPDLSLTVRAAGTGMSGGSLNSGIIVDIQHLNEIKEVKKLLSENQIIQSSYWGHEYAITGKAIAQPGTLYRDFEKETLAHDLVLPCYPASREICKIGGMVANNGAGEKSLKYGQNKDFVKAVKVILSDGNEYEFRSLTRDELKAKMSQDDFEGELYTKVYELVRAHYELIESRKPTTSKNSAGYLIWDVLQAPSFDAFEKGEGMFDMTKLFVGAQGTTGVITEIEYGLVDMERETKLLVVYVDDMKTVPDLVSRLMEHDVEMLEMYDDQTFRLGVKFMRDFIKDKGIFGAIRYAIRFFPEIRMALMGDVPKLVVLAEFVSNDKEGLRCEAIEAQKSIEHLKMRSLITKHKHDEEKFWDFRHDSFKLLTEHTKKSRTTGKGTRTAPFIDDVAVNPEHLPQYLPRLISILHEYDLDYTIAGHLGNGNFHIIPLMDMTVQKNKDMIVEVSEKVYELALEFNGSITAEHNDGIIRTPFLEDMFGPQMNQLFKKIKKIFDPENIFNPGKKIGLTKEDIKKYLA